MENNDRLKETQPSDQNPVGHGAEHNLVGKQIEDYIVTKEIGRGGMAIVYEAHQVSLDRTVALKIIPHEFTSDANSLKRFKREASAMANFSHPNIVSIHGFGEYENFHYYVMDLVKGKTLDAILEDKKHELLKSARRLPINESLKIVEQIANALSYAHKNGVIHRDIKPSNIIINPEAGQVLISDFGLAWSDKWEKITPRASLFGTPAYMSPEQAGGKELTFKTDIYSLGAVLFEMLTGNPPFQGHNVLEVIDKVKNDSIPSPRDINPNIPTDIELIVLKAMSKDIRLRYQSIDDMIVELQKFTRASLAKTVKKSEPVAKLESPAHSQPIILSRTTESSHRANKQIIYAVIFVIVATVLLAEFYIFRDIRRKKEEIRIITNNFQLAEKYQHSGMVDEAKRVYKDIIGRYMNTVYAARAAEKLSKLGVRGRTLP